MPGPKVLDLYAYYLQTGTAAYPTQNVTDINEGCWQPGQETRSWLSQSCREEVSMEMTHRKGESTTGSGNRHSRDDTRDKACGTSRKKCPEIGKATLHTPYVTCSQEMNSLLL